jgi:hypothetical protein
MDHKTIIESRKRVRSPLDITVEHAVPQAKKRPQNTPKPSENQVQEPAIPRTSNIARGEPLLYTPGTPIS